MISMIHPHELSYGQIRYFEANRCLNTDKIKKNNQNRITCDEIVSFDCGLFSLNEMDTPNRNPAPETQQLLAVIMRPGKEPDWYLQHKTDFVFCGYDLVEALSLISAITDCGASFRCIDYEHLTQYGLIRTYKEAVLTQLSLIEEDPNESHADCEIVEIWRKLV